MKRTGRGARSGRAMSPAAYLGAGLVFLVVVLLTLTGTVGAELTHRRDASWTYRRITLTDCRDSRAAGVSTVDHRCSVTPSPPLPVSPAVSVLIVGKERPPTGLWLHVEDGTVTSVDARHSLWPALVLTLPLFYLLGAVTVFIRSRGSVGG